MYELTLYLAIPTGAHELKLRITHDLASKFLNMDNGALESMKGEIVTMKGRNYYREFDEMVAINMSQVIAFRINKLTQ